MGTTKNILIEQGTRKGCPLSPLFRISKVSINNNVVRNDKKIKGLKIKNEQYKIQAFVADLLFILDYPVKSLACLMERLKQFGEIGGMKINYDKT